MLWPFSFEGGPVAEEHNWKSIHPFCSSFGAGKIASEAKRIDVISRFIFPLSFAGFNVMYWAYYLTKSYYSKGITDSG